MGTLKVAADETLASADYRSMASINRSTAYRTRRLFSSFAALLMILVVFAAIPRDVRAGADQPIAQSLASQSVTYGPGWERIANPDGKVEMHHLPTFQRWDGVWRPVTSLNRSTGDWPYQLADSPSRFSVTRLGATYVQAKIAGATYEFRPEVVKETITIPMAPPTPVVSVALTATALNVTIANNTILLSLPGGLTMWTAGGFHAWDSSLVRQAWENAVSSLAFSNGILNVTLNADMLAHAVFPLYVDPTWTLSSTAGWGSSTFQNAATDLGDGSVKIGMFADNFNNNAATGWLVSGATFSGGTMNFPGPFVDWALHTATWSTENVQFDAYFANYGGSGTSEVEVFPGATCSSCNPEGLIVEQDQGKLIVISGSNVWANIPETINTRTWYTVRFFASGFYREVYWNGVRVWSGNVPFAVPTGGVLFVGAEPTSASVDNVRVWTTNTGSITTPVRSAGTNRPLQTEILGTVDAYNQVHVQIRSSPNNSTWDPWTNAKADMAGGIPYNEPDQERQQYYQLTVVLTTGKNSTPVLTQISTTEGTIPAASPTSNTGIEPWYPYVGGTVNLVTGNLYSAASDLSFQGRGFVLGVTRAYNSLLASQSGPFGQGWTFNYGQSLTINGNGNVTWNGPDGSQFLFVAKGTTGGFSPPMGVPNRLVKNADGTYNLWTPDGGNEKFSSAGLLQTITDKNGNALTLTYSNGNHPLLTKVADATGKALAFTYDGSNRVTLVKDSANRQVSYTYGASNGLASVTDPLLNKSQYTYYSGTPIYLKQIVDPVGKSTLVNYVSGGKVSSLWLQSVNTGTLAVIWQFREFTVAYNSSTARAVQNARGYWTTLSLNSFGNTLSVSGPSIGCACDSRGNSSAYLWDSELNKIKITDGRSNSWSMTYGFRRNLLTTTDPGGNLSSEAWIEVNNATNYFVAPSSTTTFRTFTTTMAYDWKGNLLSVTDAGGNRTQYGYDSSGFLNKTVSPLLYTTWFVYNASGWLVKQVDPLNDVTQYGYDILGRGTSMTDPLTLVTSTAYDADSRVTKVTDPTGNFTTYKYDARGDVTQVTDPDLASTTLTINVTNGKVQSANDPGGNVTQSAYDVRGNLNATTNANLHTSYYAYDSFDRLTRVTTPLNHITKYVYDAAGNRIARTDGNGATTKYAYDKLNRLSSTMYPGPPVYPSPQTLTYSYDQDGNMVTAGGFGYTETFGYDRSDRLSSTGFNFGTYSVTTSYTYDKDGNEVTMTLGTSVTKYFYDRVERLTGILDPEGQNTTFGYDKDSRQTSETNPSGVRTASFYDKAGRLKAMYTNTSTGTVLESFLYAYDKAGYMTAETDVQGGTTTVTSLVYTKEHRQYKATQGSSTTEDTYDAVGNPATETTGTYTNDADNELTKAAFSPTIYVAYTYDKNGNRVTATVPGRGTTTYGYDYENRLVSTSGGCSYTYAPTGERVTSTCTSGTTDLAYDRGIPGGSNLRATYTPSGTQTARFIDANAMNTPVEIYEGGNHYAYQTDALGSVRMVTGASQNATLTYAYDTWGSKVSQGGTLANPLQYTGCIFDSSNGFYDDRARFYDPSGDGGHRFLSQDPQGGGYAYAGDSPKNFVDPTGMAKKGDGGGGGGSSGSGVNPSYDSQQMKWELTCGASGCAYSFNKPMGDAVAYYVSLGGFVGGTFASFLAEAGIIAASGTLVGLFFGFGAIRIASLAYFCGDASYWLAYAYLSNGNFIAGALLSSDSGCNPVPWFSYGLVHVAP